MRKEVNAKLQTVLKEFKKGNRIPDGYKAVFNNGVTTIDVHGNHGSSCGVKIGTEKEYSYPEYVIFKKGNDEDILFFIIANDDYSVSVMSECEAYKVSSVKEAFEIGLKL